MDAPTQDLIRAVLAEPALGSAYVAPEVARSFELRAAGDGEGRTMVGYPIVFDVWTEIDSWEGKFLERVAGGAVDKTVKERADQIKVLFNHGFDSRIGDWPLGRPDVMKGDRLGMWAEVPLSRTSYNDDLIELIGEGAVSGQSFRFSITREEWNDEPKPSEANPKGIPERTIREIKLYEFGPVTFPAYEATTVGIRSRQGLALWQSVPPERRSALVIEGTRFSDAADSGTSDQTDDAPPTGAPVETQVGMSAGARERVLRELVLEGDTP